MAVPGRLFHLLCPLPRFSRRPQPATAGGNRRFWVTGSEGEVGEDPGPKSLIHSHGLTVGNIRPHGARVNDHANRLSTVGFLAVTPPGLQTQETNSE